MGASGREYVVPYQQDLGAALDALRRDVFAAGAEDYGTIRPLSDTERADLFGTAQPGCAEYERLAGTERLHDYVIGGRWTGRAAVLWESGAPAEIVFWGYSGD